MSYFSYRSKTDGIEVFNSTAQRLERLSPVEL